MKTNQQTEPQSELLDFVRDAKRLNIRTHAHPCVSLVAPLIGSDFVAGIDENTGNWVCIGQRQIESLIAQSSNDDLPAVRSRNVTLAKLLSEVPVPTRIIADGRSAVVTAFNGGWAVLAGRNQAIGLQSIELLSLLDAPDAELAEVAA